MHFRVRGGAALPYILTGGFGFQGFGWLALGLDLGNRVWVFRLRVVQPGRGSYLAQGFELWGLFGRIS